MAIALDRSESELPDRYNTFFVAFSDNTDASTTMVYMLDIKAGQF